MSQRDFVSQGGFNTNFERDPEEHKSFAHAEDFTNQPIPPAFGYPQQQYQPNYMNMGSHNQMYYPYQGQYMNPYSYNYGSSPYKGNNYNNERRGYQGYRKYSNQSPPTKHIIYSKKPKQPVKTEEGDLAEDFNKLSVKDNGSTATGHGLTEKLPSHIEKAQFFVIKSYSEEDVHKAIKYNVWCSTIAGNVKLHEAFVSADNQYPIYLLFSVNSSGHFVGVAEMKSPVDFDKNFDAWNQNQKWKGVFSISWIYIKDVPNREFRHLKNEYNEGKPVPNSRDSQEIPFEIGKQVLEIFDKYKNQTSILDDFDFYEKKQIPPK